MARHHDQKKQNKSRRWLGFGFVVCVLSCFCSRVARVRWYCYCWVETVTPQVNNTTIRLDRTQPRAPIERFRLRSLPGKQRPPLLTKPGARALACVHGPPCAWAELHLRHHEGPAALNLNNPEREQGN